MVPMLTCGLLRSNFAFATAVLLRTLLMRHATSGTDSGRQGVGGWIWTGFSVEPGPVTVEVRKPPTIPTVQGTDGRAVGPIRTPGITCSRQVAIGRRDHNAPLRTRWRSLVSSFACRLRDDFLRHVRRNFRIPVEHHRVRRPTLGPRPQVADVAEHLRQRNQRRDDPGTRALTHGLDLPTPRG